MKFRKDALYPGTWHLPDRRIFTAKPEDVAHLQKRATEMMAAGLSLPLAWEHQDDAKPMTQAERLASAAKFNLGFLDEATLSDEGILETLFDVPVEDDAKRLPAARFVSPEIAQDFTDGTGRKWPGASITHFAVTARPVQIPQKPFRRVQMSRQPVRLSLAAFKPYRFGEAMNDETPPKKDDDVSATDDGGRLKKVLKALASVGLVLPDDTTPDNLIERLETAALTLEGVSGGTPPVEPPSPPPDASSPVVMSLTKELLSLKRDDLSRRAQSLFATGRVGKPVRDKLLADLGKVQLSLSPQGGLAPNSVVNRIEAYEELEKGSAFPVVDLSHGERPGLPREGRHAPETPSEVAQAMNDIDTMMGRKKKTG